ncbi:MAG: heat-inducible transcription repressor HrcA [Clostridia bacterium]|nr:heat-inducible transcription repressor HrcA [Clostridia bacterium]
MSKELSERKKKILHSLVDLYIATGQPVSSADLQSKYLPEVSSATIRAELSALEALGYIEQPHTSAGRIPLKEAYKFYVDSIDGSNACNMLTDQETAFIRNNFFNRLGQIEDLSKEAARIISDVTNYTSFVVDQSQDGDVTIDEIKLIPLKRGKAVVLIVTDKGMIADKAIDVKEDVKPEYIETAGRVLNKVFAGKTIEDIKDFDLKEIDNEIKGFKDIFDEVLGILRMYISEHSSDNVFVEGALKMLDYPEYQNIDDAKQFLSVISDKDAVSEIILSEDNSIEFTVRIGKEDSGVDKCAIITAAYKVGDEVQGKAGVIGPERMDYKKVISVLDYVKKMFSTVLGGTKSLNPFDDEE